MPQSRDEVAIIVESRKEKIVEAIQKGLRDYRTQYDEVVHIHSARTKSSIINDHIIYHARQIFEGEPGVEFKKSRGMFYLLLDGKVALRFKKLSRKKLASNIPTEQTRLFDWQQQFLPGTHEEITNTNAGYIPNALGTDSRAMMITRPNGRHRIAWFIPIGDSAATSLFETPVVQPSTLTGSKRAKPREMEEKRRKKGAIDNGGTD